MFNTVRGNGIGRVDWALAALVEDPERLERARSRFSEPPPAYTSEPSQDSYDSTLSHSPDAPDEEQRRREEERWRLKTERMASLPMEQFSDQWKDEAEQLRRDDANGTHPLPVCTDFEKLARQNVRKRWVEQGIWNDKWPGMAFGRWRHEEPLEPSSESESDDGTASPAGRGLFSHIFENAVPTPRRTEDDEEVRRAAGAQAEGRKHEEPLEPSSSSKANSDEGTEPEVVHTFFGQYFKHKAPTPRRPEDDEEDRRAAEARARAEARAEARSEARAKRQRDHEVSRPFHQFIYHVSKEFDRIQEDLKREPASTSVPLDIGTTAYENIRSTWLRRLIWDKKWGTLPGMSWKHERPLEDLAIDSGPGPFELPAAELNRRFHILGNGEREQPRGEDLDDYPAAVVFEPPAAGSNPLFPMPGNGQRPRSPSIDSTVDLGGNAQRSRSTSRSPPHIVRRNDPSTRRHGLRQREQNRSLTAAPLGPIHQSKVVKLPRTRRPGRGQRAAGKVSDHSASSLGAEQREPGGEASSTSRRRSRRLQNKAEDAGKLISTDIPKNLPGARRERTGAGTIKPKAPAKPQASAKPRGVSRRKPSNTSNRGKKA